MLKDINIEINNLTVGHSLKNQKELPTLVGALTSEVQSIGSATEE